MFNRGFWETLQTPILGLAPMDGVTDAAFRYMVAKYGHPAVMFTEFTAVEGIRAGAERLLDDFLYDEIERPVVAQLFGSDPAAFYIGAVTACALGFDGIDINMGCPAKNITEKGAGAALIRDPERAKEIVRETRRGISDWANGISLEAAEIPENIIAKLAVHERRVIPVSIKTRMGYDEIVVEEWMRNLLEVEPANITLHGRTLRQGYTGEANWDAIARAAEIVHAEAPATTLLGNGDVSSVADAKARCAQYGTDGALLGRVTFGNPWVFTDHVPTFDERMAAALEHARVLHRIVSGRGFIRIRKHLLDYCRGADGAKELRMKLMKVNSIEDVETILSSS